MLMLEAALSYAALGWRVFPLQPRSKVPPHGFKWQREHAPNEEVIRAWWTTWPDANIGIATGSASGFWCLDVDPRNGGDDSLDQLIAEIGKLPDTVEALTGGGGRHILFLCTGEPIPCGKLGPGLDVKGDGGYIVAHPSIHPDTGNAYEWEASSSPFDGVAIAAAPAALLERLTPNERSAAPVASPGADLPIPQGMRDNALTSLAGSLRRLGMGPDAIAGVLHAENLRRCQPPLHDKDIERIARSVARYAPGADYAATAHGAQVAQALATSTAATQPADRERFRFLKVSELTPKPVEWLVKDFVARGDLVLLYGAPGTMKSFVAIDIGLSIATGQSWHGRDTAAGPVLFIIGEGHAGYARRLAAWAQHHGISIDDAPIFVSNQRARLTDAGAVDEVAAAIAEATMQTGAPAFLVVDTLHRNFGLGDENSAKDMGAFVAAVSDLARAYSATMMIVHHTGHGDPTRPRASSALTGAMDVEYLVTRDKDAMAITVKHGKPPKDFEPPAPLRLNAVPVTLGTDHDGEPMTSLALHLALDVDQVIDNLTKGLGKNQEAALQALRRVYDEHRQRLTSTGFDPAGARVMVVDWKTAMRDMVDAKRQGEAIAALERRGFVRLEGGYAYLLEDAA